MTFHPGVDPNIDGQGAHPRRRERLWRAEARHIRDVTITAAIAVIISVVIRQFLFGIYAIPSESMSPTLEVGDRIGVTMYVPEIEPVQRGDVIVFTDPGGWLPPAAAAPPVVNPVVSVLRFIGVLPPDAGNLVIKRVVGMPGDHVVCCDSGGQLTVNGEALDERYLDDDASELDFDITVPAGTFWVMGDNRDNSADSRLQGTPFVPVENVVGRAGLVIWPLERGGTLTRD